MNLISVKRNIMDMLIEEKSELLLKIGTIISCIGPTIYIPYILLWAFIWLGAASA